MSSGPALVTGAAGFAGSHLVERLSATNTSVVGWHRADLDLLDRDAVRARVSELRPSAVYHCAGAPQVAESWENTTHSLASNVLATHHLLDAIRLAGIPCRVLIAGSATVYRAADHALTEDAPLRPASPYALSKLAQEQLGRLAAAADGLDIVTTRPFNHTGPRQRSTFAGPAMARQLAMIEAGQAEPVLRVGNLDARRDITDVRDVVRAYQLLMDRGRPGVAYNVCSGTAPSIRDLLDGLRRRVSVFVRVEIDPARLRPNDTPLVMGSHARLTADTGWTPEISFDRMLDDLLDYWRGVVKTESTVSGRPPDSPERPDRDAG